jgi:hypothetical protein
VYGVAFEPHADATSLALVALLPQKEHPLVKRCLAWLQRQWDQMLSIYSLSWMAMALAGYQ